MGKAFDIWLHPRKAAAEISSLSGSLDETLARLADAETQADSLRQEISRLRSALADAETDRRKTLGKMSALLAESHRKEALMNLTIEERTLDIEQIRDIEQLIDKMILAKKNYTARIRSLKRELSEARIRISRLQGDSRDFPATIGFGSDPLPGVPDPPLPDPSRPDDSSDWLDPLPLR